jgi:hypothetical protein
LPAKLEGILCTKDFGVFNFFGKIFLEKSVSLISDSVGSRNKVTFI